MFLALMENPDFKMEFADRVYKHLFNDGALTDANSQARWLSINQQIEQAIIGESARWGDVRYTDNPIDQEDWLQARDKVLKQMPGNGDKLISLLREADYYPPIDPPEFEVTSQHVRLNILTGTVYYTLDGSDPRESVTGNISPKAQRYQQPILLTTTTHLEARAFDGKNWSANVTHSSDCVQSKECATRLQITELMYHPIGGNKYEFIELKNVGNADMNLAGSYFEGIKYSFPPVMKPVAPGEILVLVSDFEAFQERYPGVEVAGIYQGRLSNGGETIRLINMLGSEIISISYDDTGGWPVSADGRGDSLSIVDELGRTNDPANWQGSPQRHGSPGE
jgi:hypothetical protein